MLRRPLAALLAGTALCSTGCSNQLAPESAAGVYHARTLLITELTPPVDMLALGVTLTLQLGASGTTSGRFTAPLLPGFEDTPFDLDLAGRYTIENDRVRFSHDADTFLRDVPWTIQAGRLVATTDELMVVLER